MEGEEMEGKGRERGVERERHGRGAGESESGEGGGRRDGYGRGDPSIQPQPIAHATQPPRLSRMRQPSSRSTLPFP